jgi:hypothetical protein
MKKNVHPFFKHICMVEIIVNTRFLENLKMCRIFTKQLAKNETFSFLTLVFQVECERNLNPRTPSLTSTGTSTGKNCSLSDFLCAPFMYIPNIAFLKRINASFRCLGERYLAVNLHAFSKESFPS